MSGHIRKRGSTWTIYYSLGRDADNKRQQRSKGGFRTKREAQAKLDAILYKRRAGEYVEPSKLSVAEFFREWIQTQRTKLAATTFAGYDMIMSVHVISEIGGTPLQQLTALEIEQYYERKRGSGLSEQTLLHHHRLIKKALGRAVQLQFVIKNVAIDVEAPKPKKVTMRALDPQETVRLLKLFEGSAWYPLVVTSVATGMRRGELLALTWKDVDLNEGCVRIRSSVEQTKGNVAIKEPKTKSSRRKIMLPAFLVDLLRRHQLEQKKLALKLGTGYVNDRVFPGAMGGWTPPASYTHAFTRHVKGTEFEGVRLHDMRHTHASQLLLAGTHPKVVSERLGHSNIAITLDTYSHLLPGIDQEAANKIDEALGSLL